MKKITKGNKKRIHGTLQILYSYFFLNLIKKILISNSNATFECGSHSEYSDHFAIWRRSKLALSRNSVPILHCVKKQCNELLNFCRSDCIYSKFYLTFKPCWFHFLLSFVFKRCTSDNDNKTLIRLWVDYKILVLWLNKTEMKDKRLKKFHFQRNNKNQSTQSIQRSLGLRYRCCLDWGTGAVC